MLVNVKVLVLSPFLLTTYTIVRAVIVVVIALGDQVRDLRYSRFLIQLIGHWVVLGALRDGIFVANGVVAIQSTRLHDDFQKKKQWLT